MNEAIDIEVVKTKTDILAEYMGEIGKTVKRDKLTATAVFITALSAWSRNPLNLFLKGPSSIGKSYTVTETVRYFPEANVVLLGGLSTTALSHDYGRLLDGDTGAEIDPDEDTPRKEDFEDPTTGKIDQQAYRLARKAWRKRLRRAYYEVDLTHKILVFLEEPNPETLMRLRPILSHDAPEISYKHTDRIGNEILSSITTKIKGWPATIFCTTNQQYIEELATRSFTHTPSMDVEKYREAIKLKGAQGAYPWEFTKEGQLYKALRDYLTVITSRLSFQNSVVIPYASVLSESYPVTMPRDMRDYDHFQMLISVSTLLHYFQRPVITVNSEKYLVATFQDLRNGLELYHEVEETTRVGLPGHILGFFKNVILPLWVDRQTPLNYKELATKHNGLGIGKISTKRVSDYVEELREVGWIDTERDNEVDKRRNLVTVIKNPDNHPNYSVGRIQGLFIESELDSWLDRLEKYSSEKIVLYRNILDSNPLDIHLLKSLFSAEYLNGDKINDKGETVENRALNIPPEHSGAFPSDVSTPVLQEKLEDVVKVFSDNHNAASTDEIASKLGIPVEEVERLLKAMERDRLVYVPAGQDYWRLVPP